MQVGEQAAKPFVRVRPFDIGEVEHQTRELAMALHDGDHVRLEGERRMHLGPIVCRAHECQECSEKLECSFPPSRHDGSARSLRPPGSDEHDGERVEQIAFHLCPRIGHGDCWLLPLEPRQRLLESLGGRQRPFQQREGLFDRVRCSGRIAARPALADEKSHVAHDAVPNLTEPRQVDEQALLEERRQGVVEVTGLGKAPQLLNQFRRRGGCAEEVGQDTEAFPDLRRKLLCLCHSIAPCRHYEP